MVNYLENIIGDFEYLNKQAINLIETDDSRHKDPLLVRIRNRMNTNSDRVHNNFMGKIGLCLDNIMDLIYNDIGKNGF